MQCVIDRTVRGAPAERRSGSFTALLLILGALLANKTQSSHRITAGGKRRVAIPGVLVAATLSRGGGAFLGSCDRVYASSATLSFRG